MRNRPEMVLDKTLRKAKFIVPGGASSTFHRLSGFVYVFAGLLKGATASILSVKSHSLGQSRYPLFALGVWDVFTCVNAYRHIRNRNIALHKDWMIRNFCAGAGSIWVRVFGGVWAAFDLSILRNVELYRQMNNIVLVAGFGMGILYGEFSVAKTQALKSRWKAAMVAWCIGTGIVAKKVHGGAAKTKAQQVHQV